MTSATTPSLTLVVSSLDHPDARTLADQGELASIYGGGPTTGRDTALPANLAPPHGLFFVGYLDDVAVAAAGCDCAEILRTMEEHARAADATRAVLEAGIFSRNAVRLYAAAGRPRTTRSDG